MSLISRCPDCGKILSSEKTRCTCGWSMKQLDEVEENDDQCQHEEFGKRCDKVGTICRSIRSKKSKWFCATHWYQVDNKKCDKS